MHKLKFLLLTFGFTFFLFTFNLACYAQDKIVAIVNNDIITQKDLDDFENFMRLQLEGEYKGEQLEQKIQSMKSDLLEKLVEDRLILQEAKKENIKIDENRVKARVEEIRRRYPSAREFQAALRKQGLVQADIANKIREQLLMFNIVELKVKSKIMVKPGEVTDFFQKNSAEFKSLEIRELEVVAVEDEAFALEIFKGLKAGQTLKDLAEQHSLSVNKLTIMKNGQWRKEIEDAVFDLNVGKISSPVRAGESSYIFQLDNIIAPKKQNLSEVSDGIYDYLFNQKMQEALALWLDGLKKHSYIKIF
ncbi:MAG: hypothetical protein A2984_00710 [Omnitrophica WOR_2 bacterium RIFCSPLOWO2_01_FULL_41_12]|nr:MAG: hypothetical protein A2984_00710 [Omnitrophica WOR_2 bacterium RIFCSPLOWO2_01_FULL_41_12]